MLAVVADALAPVPLSCELISSAVSSGALSAVVRVSNTSASRETIVRDLSVRLRAVGCGVSHVAVTVRRVGAHPGWVACSVAAGGSVAVELSAPIPDGFVAGELTAVGVAHTFAGSQRVTSRWFVSAPQEPQKRLRWRAVGCWRAAPVSTHIWTPGERLGGIVERFVLPHWQRGDVLVVAESPLAVTQGRLRHADDVRVRLPARVLARLFSGTGSLGSAAGLQCLIDEVGAVRFADAFAVGAAGKLAGVEGGFYRRLGPVAALVDDVSGTLAPYDQCVVLGPIGCDLVAAEVFERFGLPCVVVDANDLGRVDVIGAAGVDARGREGVIAALSGNPAGNADERTPLVLLRPAG